jgi:hypothetical protein
MATVTELQAMLESVRRARASGVLTIRKGDDSTTFRSLKEMDAIIAGLEAELANADGAKRYRTLRVYSGSGW